jgi:hypothetical protein
MSKVYRPFSSVGIVWLVDYFKENISQILSVVFLAGVVLWFLAGASETLDERKRVRRIDENRARSKTQEDYIQALLKAKKFEAAKRQIDAPIDKNGNHCHYDEPTGRWMQRNKNGTWSEYRP